MFMILLYYLSATENGVVNRFRLTASVEAVILNGEVDKLRHIILLQGCTSQRCDEIRISATGLGGVLSSEEAISSPAARNA